MSDSSLARLDTPDESVGTPPLVPMCWGRFSEFPGVIVILIHLSESPPILLNWVSVPWLR
jgi:hypothetical protein